MKVTSADPDASGGLSALVTEYTFDDAGQVSKVTSPGSRDTEYFYDALGRLTLTKLPDPDGIGGLDRPELGSSYDAAGRKETDTDALGNVTTYEYDLLDNLIKVTQPDPDGGGLSAPVSEWVYDKLNRVIEETNHLNDSRYFVYDAAGNLRQRTDRNERVMVFEYDNLHRRTAEEWWDGTLPSIGVSTSANGSTTSEVQRVGFSDSTAFESGTFTLTYSGQTTSAIPYSADAATVQAALVALSNIGSGEVSVVKLANSSTHQEWEITFTGALAGTNAAQITIDSSAVYNGIGAPGTEIEDTDTTGATVDEVQVITLSNTTGGTFTLSFGGASTAALDWDATTGEVDSALEALSGAGTVSVSGSTGGPFTITFTGDYSGLNLAPLLTRSNNLTNGDLLRTIASTFDASGDLSELSDPDATYEYAYDTLGRVVSYVQNLAGLTPEIEFQSQYNTASRRELLQTILDGDEDFQNTYTYDDLLRLTALIQQSGADNVVAAKRIEFNVSVR